MQKPVLFIDFDDTLFDTGQFYDWLGGEADERLAALLAGKIEQPDFASMLYSDTLDFLKRARVTHELVLLTYTSRPSLQDMKVRGSGIVPYLDKVILAQGKDGNSGKGMEAKKHLRATPHPPHGHSFVDDFPDYIAEVKSLNPEIRCIQIKRDEPRKSGAIDIFPPDDVVSDLNQLFRLLCP